MKKFLSSALVLAPVLIICGATAQADEWNKRTIINVNRAIEVPGTVLPAGTYVFKLADSASDRHMVQVFNEDENHLFTTVVAIPNYRLEPTGHTVLSFYEVPAGQPQPVKAWFYPGDQYGQEFVYPPAKMAAIQAPPPPEQPQAAPPPPEQPAPAPAPAPAPPPEQPQAAVTPPPAPAPAPVMPKTASDMPLLVLLGLLSIGAATGLSVFAKRTH